MIMGQPIIITNTDQTTAYGVYHNNILEIDKLKNNDIPAVCEYLNNHPEVSGLSIPYGEFDDEGVKLLAQLLNVSYLDISRNEKNITSKSAQYLSQYCRQLKALDISTTFIGDEGACFLAGMNLLFLNVTNCGIGDLGACSLAENTTIKKLLIDGNKIGDVGVNRLANNKILFHLSISFNRFSHESALVFCENKTLTEISLIDCQEQARYRIVNSIQQNKINNRNITVAANTLFRHSYVHKHLRPEPNIVTRKLLSMPDKILIKIAKETVDHDFPKSLADDIVNAEYRLSRFKY